MLRVHNACLRRISVKIGVTLVGDRLDIESIWEFLNYCQQGCRRAPIGPLRSGCTFWDGWLRNHCCSPWWLVPNGREPNTLYLLYVRTLYAYKGLSFSPDPLCV